MTNPARKGRHGAAGYEYLPDTRLGSHHETGHQVHKGVEKNEDGVYDPRSWAAIASGNAEMNLKRELWG